MLTFAPPALQGWCSSLSRAAVRGGSRAGPGLVHLGCREQQHPCRGRWDLDEWHQDLLEDEGACKKNEGLRLGLGQLGSYGLKKGLKSCKLHDASRWGDILHPASRISNHILSAHIIS